MTYNEFADLLLKSVVAKSYGSNRIDVVFDVYHDHSIKNAERGNRSTGELQFSVIIGSAKIKQWGTFLSNNKNKAAFIRFLVSRWKDHPSELGQSNLFLGFDTECICVRSNGHWERVEALESNHEEADTRMLLHAQHICQTFEKVVIYTPDTDVSLIAIGASQQMNGSFFIL